MNDWARRRKRIILAIFLFVLLILIGIPVFLFFYEKPTCNDLKLNGDETGVDCGGSCQLLCRAESLPLISKGDPRILTVATSTFEVVALYENPNNDAQIPRAAYEIKLYGAMSTIPVKVLEGEVFIPKKDTFAVFVGPFNLDEGVLPTRATLEWKKERFLWEKNIEPVAEVSVKFLGISGEASSPRLEAQVENLSLEVVPVVDLVAFIANEQGNIFAASKTFVENLAPGKETPAIFSWPRPFKDRAIDIRVFAKVLSDRSYIR